MSMSESESDEERVAGIDFDFSNANSASRIALAVREVNFTKVKELIDQGCAVDIPDNRGFTALHEAAQNDRCYKIARLLIKSGSFVDHVTHNGDTPLHFAVYRSCRKIVKLLLSQKCLLDKHNLDGLTPLHYACIKNDIEIVKLLLNSGADINAKTYVDETPIYKAIQESNINTIELLIQSGADLSINDYYNRSLLQISCASDPKIFDILFPHFPKNAVDHSSDDGWTILMESLQLRNYDIAAKLIQNGADTTKTDFRDLLPLHIAAHSGSYECFELILTKTPPSAIEQYAVISGAMVHSRSLACLLLDKHMYEGLQLFLNSNLHKDVIACPTMMGERLVSPVCFLLLHTCIEDKMKYLELLLTRDELVFPIYEGHSFATTLEALTTTHILPHNCQCVEMLHLLLEKGADPDLTSNGKFLPDFFYRLLISNFVQGVFLALQYTKFIEPRHLLNVYCEEFPRVPTQSEFDDYLPRMKMMEPLLSITTDVNTPLSLLKLATKSNVGKRVYEYLLKNHKVPSLKTLSRSSIREHVRQNSEQNEFLQALRSLPLPKPMINYLTYKILC